MGAANAGGRGFLVDTKILPTGPGLGKGSLTEEAIAKSLAPSPRRLRVDQVSKEGRLTLMYRAIVAWLILGVTVCADPYPALPYAG